ncbi:hypothetical protein [Mesorhizobium sp. M0491]|uniref:hypothetical protein n=1 Tax=Mesorhizobium sp. M0491 TaxID=2956950 RepID=UPI0033386403
MIRKAQAASRSENFSALVSAAMGNSSVASGRKTPKMPIAAIVMKIAALTIVNSW